MAIYSNDIEGLDELIEAFNLLSDEALLYVEEASIKSAEVIKAKAIANLAEHNKTGNLSRNLKVTKPSIKRKTKHVVFARVWFSAKGFYGVHLELGHRLVRNKKLIGTVREYPFLRPAADSCKDLVADNIAEAMNKALDQMGGVK